MNRFYLTWEYSHYQIKLDRAKVRPAPADEVIGGLRSQAKGFNLMRSRKEFLEFANQQERVEKWSEVSQVYLMSSLLARRDGICMGLAIAFIARHAEYHAFRRKQLAPLGGM